MTNHRQEQTVKKITSVTYTVDESVEEGNTRQNSREKVAKRKNQNNNQIKQNIFTLTPIDFNFYTTTAKPLRKTTKNSSSQSNVTEKSNKKPQKISHQRLPSDELYDTNYGEKWFDKPAVNNINELYEITTRPVYNNQNRNQQNNNYDNEYSYPNYNNQFTTKRPESTTAKQSNAYTTKNPFNTYTTKNPFYNQPGVKPAIVDSRPPITNKPVTNRPVTNKPYTTRPTYKATNRPVSIPASPTESGSISFPEDDTSPEIIMGPNEDYMSDSEKRRHIETAERSKYTFIRIVSNYTIICP